MSLSKLLASLKIDGYILALIGMVVLASFLPIHGPAAGVLAIVVKLAIGLLFFLHGAKLSREAVVAGVTHWRLHLTILAFTFALFPVLGLLASRSGLLSPTLAAGMVFLACLPSTVQSSIAFTSMARGNVAAAVCAASASNLLGIFVTPVLVSLLMHAQGGAGGWKAIQDIIVQLLLPFVAGQLVRPLISGWLDRHKPLIGYVDRGSILLVVYAAFSAAVYGGLWKRVSPLELLALVLVCGVLLVVVLLATTFGARSLGFSKADEIAIVFCGSKKSLATGVPMAGILFPSATAGVLVLPLMIFHQIQLMACSVIAQHYAKRTGDET
ncbi:MULTISPECIES: bile acid:sodium symporter family protein [unclassified Caulobacter]|uniref:bile acid:sodium symporter family protein n=1 Tax=unclassified Caulobacter TaxID=2648921 RepID=UPI000D3913FC|nr:MULTISPECIES: bile acid:sodium symporter family protein [unclassified Caulobacter]PTS89413.1 bile acid:sodium symporter [Caulobacter sp. HMWF009]PTT04465.1 bile acid:sodium symporter [Caulobacter sp. HMWF025]PTT77148.1 bile acid:sodium symporter [Pseudomonas sp. HMWF010]